MADKRINPDSFFRKSLTKQIVKPLKDYEFYRYKTAYIGRVTNDSVFQFLNFQKEAYGGKSFTVNVGVRPLFVPHDNLSLQPGQRLGYFKFGTDKWWKYENEDRAEDSFKEVNEIIIEYVLKWFEATNDTDGLINLYTDDTQVRIIPTSLNWKYFDLGHLYARSKQYEKAIDAIEISLGYFNSQPYDWYVEASEKCEKFINVLKGGQLEVDYYLKSCEKISRINLGLLDY